MTDPVLEITSHLQTHDLVVKANDEIRALCLGPLQKGGRRWTMCVPVQPDDSDIILAAAIRRLQEDRRRDQDREMARGEADVAEIRRLKQEVYEAERERDKLAAFKAYVHQRLTDAGVPADPDSSETLRTGCRIGLRIHWLLDQLATARAAAAKASA